MKDAAHDAVHSEKAEHVSDTVLDGAEKAANFVTGGKLDDKIGDIRDDVDAKIGDDEARAAAEKGGSGAARALGATGQARRERVGGLDGRARPADSRSAIGVAAGRSARSRPPDSRCGRSPRHPTDA